MKNKVIEILGIPEALIENIYCFGSRVYGSFGENSDYDFIVVTDAKNNGDYVMGNINIQCYSIEEFQKRLFQHDIEAIECFFLKEKFKLMGKTSFYFELDLQTLRQSISKKSSNSWVKAKKKLLVDKDYDLKIARKSVFHSLRIVDFGIQLGKYGKIVNYSSANKLLLKIQTLKTWEEMYSTFKPIHNKLLSEFRHVAIK
jgi:hypothetical protein